MFVAVAACGGDGIHIEIRPGEAPDVTSVELYLTDRTKCTIPNTDVSCRTLVFPLDNQRDVAFDGQLYQVDDPTPFRADVVDGSAWFFLAPDRGRVELAVAIGRGDGGDVLATRILTQKLDTSAGEQHVRAELRAVDHSVDEGEVSAVVWPARDDVPYHCVAAVEGGRRVAIVPEQDPDCDFVDPEHECRPTHHLASSPPAQELDKLTCATSATVAGLGDFCLLGDTACNEADPMPFACIPTTTPICVPDATCECGALDEQCLASLVEPDATHIVCTYPVSVEMDGTAGACLDITPLSLGNSVCDSVAIMPLTAPLQGFGPTIDIDVSGGPATFQPLVGADDCVLTMAPPATIFTDANEFPIQEHGLVKFSVHQPDNTLVRDVILPIVIEMHVDPTGCATQAASCILVKGPNERVSSCLSRG